MDITARDRPVAARPAVDHRDRARRIAVAVLAASFLLRLGWLFWFGDLYLGDDAPTYLRLADQLRVQGIFSPVIIPLPYWPAGYPIVMASVVSALGSLAVLQVLQVVAVTVAGYSLFRFASRTLGIRTGLVAVVVFALHPSVTGTVSWYGYEPLLLSALVVGLDLVQEGVSRTRVAEAAVGFALVGFGATLQPKALAVGAPLLAWAAYTSWRSAGPQLRRVVLVLACGVSLALAPAGLIYRNAVATGHAVLSTNGGANLVLGNNPDTIGKYVVATRQLDAACNGSFGNNIDRTPEQERVLMRCAWDYARAHPWRTVSLWPTKLWFFSGPMTGPLMHTQSHEFDVRQLVSPDISAAEPFVRVDRALSALLWAATVALGATGAVTGLRARATRSATLLTLLPVATFAGLAMLTIGGARHRVPIVPFLVMLQAHGAVFLWDRARTRSGRSAVA